MSKNKTVKQFVLVVDSYRRPSRQRSTQGRYRVGAKNAAHAKEILKKAIGFGSINVLYEDESPAPGHVLAMGVCRKETPGQGLVPVRHATAPQERG